MTDFENMIEMIKAAADKNRLRIMLMLSERPMCVCEINSVLDIALSTISAHLKQMRSAGVIISEKEGRWVIYKLAETPFVRGFVEMILQQYADDADILADKKAIAGLCREECVKKI